MLIRNVLLFVEGSRFVPGALRVENGRIAALGSALTARDGEEVLDGRGSYCFPGMIDLHLHGCRGADFCDGTPEALETIARYELSRGVTAMAAATMTLPVPQLEAIAATADTFCAAQAAGRAGGATLLGLNMEGPFISPVKKGAQHGAYILPPDAGVFRRLQRAAGGRIRIMGLAPEQPGAEDFLRELSGACIFSLAHTNASYEEACRAFDAGASHVTHLFNAMPPFGHRAPGVVGAALDHEDVMAELICDGIHVHPAVLRAAAKLFGPDRLMFISDSMRAAGMPDGRYTLGGQEVAVRGRRAELVSDGTLAGSVTPLPDCVRQAVQQAGLPLAFALRCATFNPARRLGVTEEMGLLAPGRRADLVLWTPQLETMAIFQNGRRVDPGEETR